MVRPAGEARQAEGWRQQCGRPHFSPRTMRATGSPPPGRLVIQRCRRCGTLTRRDQCVPTATPWSRSGPRLPVPVSSTATPCSTTPAPRVLLPGLPCWSTSTRECGSCRTWSTSIPERSGRPAGRVDVRAHADELAVPVFRPDGAPMTTGTGASIVGIGRRRFSKAAGRSETQLAAEADRRLADAGLDTATGQWPGQLHDRPGRGDRAGPGARVPEIHWSSRVPYGGGGSQGVLLHAAAAVAAGAADVVVAYRAIRARSGARFGAPRSRIGPTSSHSGTTAVQWCSPYGVLTPASWMSLNATRYMHTFGVTSEDFGRAVVQMRDYAATNPNAHFSAGRSPSRTTRAPVGSPNRASGCSTAARRPTAQSRSSSPAPTGRQDTRAPVAM